jgi:hypothetical protein
MGLGEGLTVPHRENQLFTKYYTEPRNAGSCYHSSELSVSIKGGEFFD